LTFELPVDAEIRALSIAAPGGRPLSEIATPNNPPMSARRVNGRTGLSITRRILKAATGRNRPPQIRRELTLRATLGELNRPNVRDTRRLNVYRSHGCPVLFSRAANDVDQDARARSARRSMRWFGGQAAATGNKRERPAGYHRSFKN
jgi:hypothetical protein